MIGMFIANAKLSQLYIEITDKYGDLATFFPDWSTTFQIIIYNTVDKELEIIKHNVMSMSDTLTKLLTLKVIQRQI